jgi:hypothetical protein
MSRVRSNPATFFTTRPPPRTTSPVPVTASSPITTSRGNPKVPATGPAVAVAMVAPNEPASPPHGVSASHWRSAAVAAAISASDVPARAVSVRSPGV